MAANSGTSTLTAAERRVGPRSCVISSHLVTVDLGFQSGALLLELNAKGMGVQAMTPALIGTGTPLRFRLPDSPGGVDGMGTVVWSDNSGHLGIRFDELTAPSRQHLETWLSRDRRPQITPDPLQDEFTLLLRDLRARNLQGDQALGFLLERTRVTTGASGAAIALEDGDGFLCRASSGAAPMVGTRLVPNNGLSGDCVRTGEVVRCDDTETYPRLDRVLCRSLDLRSAVIVPIKVQTGLIGVLEVFSSYPHAFQSSHVDLLRDVAQLIAKLTPEKPAQPAAIPAAAAPAAAPAIAAPTPAIAAPATPAVNPAPEPAIAAPATPVADLAPEPVLAAPPAGEWRTVASAASVDPASAEDIRAMFALSARPALVSARAARTARTFPRRLKILSAMLGVTMMVGSAWAGWHWGQLHFMLHPAPTLSAPTTPGIVPSLAATASVPPPGTPAAAPPDASAALHKPTIPHKKNVPLVVLAAPPSPAEDSVPLPPPAITLPGNGAEAAGLGTVLSVTAAPVSLEKQPNVSGGVTGGKLVRKVEPEYPMPARPLHLRGDVVLRASIDIRGRVAKVAVLQGSPLLAGAAANAVKRWRYQPFLLNGVAIPADVTVKVTFAPKE